MNCARDPGVEARSLHVVRGRARITEVPTTNSDPGLQLVSFQRSELAVYWNIVRIRGYDAERRRVYTSECEVQMCETLGVYLAGKYTLALPFTDIPNLVVCHSSCTSGVAAT